MEKITEKLSHMSLDETIALHQQIVTDTPKMAQPNIRIPSPGVLKSGDNICHWRLKIDSYVKALGIAEEEIKRSIILQLLNDTGLDWYQNQIKRGVINDETSAKEILDDLESFFTPISTVAHAEQEIASLTQTGTVHDYLTKFIRLCTRIPDMTDGERRRSFTRGLKPIIRRELYKKSDLTFDDCQKIALVFDSSSRLVILPQWNRNSFASSSKANQAPMHHRNEPEPMDCSAFNSKPLGKITESEKEFLRQRGGCFACRQLGHFSKDCPRFAQKKINEIIIPVEEEMEQSEKDFCHDQ